MKTTQLQVTGMSCGGCVNSVQRALSAVPGVRSVNVDLAAGRATVEHDESAAVPQLLAALREEDFDGQAL